MLTRKAACYIVTVPWLLPLLLSIQLCIIGLVTDGLLLSLIVIPHPSQALTREREIKVRKRDGKRWAIDTGRRHITHIITTLIATQAM